MNCFARPSNYALYVDIPARNFLVSIAVKISNTGIPSFKDSKNFTVRGKRSFCVVLKSRAGRIDNLLRMRKYSASLPEGL